LTTAFSCSKDDDSGEQDIHQLVENFVSPELIASLNQLDYNFMDGNDQPDISGTFRFSKNILKATNIDPDYEIGTEFLAQTFTFSNLDPESRTFDFSGVDDYGFTYGNATDSFYSGNGNNFSAYVKIVATMGDVELDLLFAISGTIAEGGIVNAESALLMLNNKGYSGYISNGQGRLFMDEDGTAARQ